MDFVFISDVLNNYNIDLEVLRPNSNLYNISLLQHIGTFHVEEDRFGNQNDEEVKFNNFLQTSFDNNSALIVTPEYSCPWNSVRNLLRNTDDIPNIGNLIVLGCESITPELIFEFKDEFNEQNNIEVHFEENIFENAGGVLLDPCCYIFKALNENGEEKIIVLIQFKTQHMGVWESALEQEKYIPGNNTYILKNTVNSINLVTVICSDALVFNNEINANFREHWELHPFLVLSIQMNPKPCDANFRTFRSEILSNQNKDIITLNWSSESIASFDNNFFSRYSKSNIHIKTEHIKNRALEEQNLIKSNHNLGLYYTFLKPDKHFFYINPKVEIALLRLRKPYQGNVPGAVVRRRGPIIVGIYEWNSQARTFNPLPEIVDEFVNLLNSLGITSKSLHDVNFSILDKERLLSISLGEIDVREGGDSWHIINKLESFQLDELETIKRFTIIFDEGGYEFRKTRLEKLEELNLIILTDPIKFPPILSSFKGNCSEVMFYKDGHFNYKYNLVKNGGDEYATVSYLGLGSKEDVERPFNKLLKLFAKEDLSYKRIVVWFKPTINTYDNKATPIPKFTDLPKSNNVSFTE